MGKRHKLVLHTEKNYKLEKMINHIPKEGNTNKDYKKISF